jgi:Caspase domain
MPDLRRALLVGIDSYDSFSSLGGCVKDAHRLQPLLAKHENGDPDFACVVRDTASRDSLVEDVRACVAPGADLALLYFAGHGSEEPGDVSLCTRDGTSTSPGLPMSQIMTEIQNSSVAEVIVILDCCFSGAAGQVPQLGAVGSMIRSGVSILAASRGDQTSAETIDGGEFTTSLVAGLEGGAADVVGKITVAGLYAYLSELFGPWDQRPTFKANVDRLHEVRKCKPAVPLDEIRMLKSIFPKVDAELSLDASYEPDAEPHDVDHEATFGILQRCRAAKLVEPVGHEHMYFAAMQSLSCRLTPLGQHYWLLADKGRL